MNVSRDQVLKLTDELWQQWEREHSGGGVVRYCQKCMEEWKKSGKNPEEKPPYFPPNYEGKCPICGNELTPPKVVL